MASDITELIDTPLVDPEPPPEPRAPVDSPYTEYAATLRLASKQRLDDVAGLIATGGNIEALAKLAGAEPEQDGVSRVPVARLT